MTAALSSLPLVLHPPRAELARLCRQIWIEHERTPRSSLEHDFTLALADVQSRFPDDAPSEEDLWEVVSAEHERVAQAATVAELLMPRLGALLRERLAPVNKAAVAQPNLQAQTGPRPAVAGVADLIEGMLDQQRNDLRRSTALERR